MNINYVRFVNSEYAILGFDRLKNQRNDQDCEVAYVAEIQSNPLSCFKLLKAYTELLLRSGGSQEDLLFPAMSGQRLLKKLVSYGAMSSALNRVLCSLNYSVEQIKTMGLHSFRSCAISAVVDSGKVSEDQLQRAGRWKSKEIIPTYTRPSTSSKLAFSKNI